MSLFKKFISKIKNSISEQTKEQDNAKEEKTFKEIKSLEEFWEEFYTLRQQLPVDKLKEETKNLLQYVDEDIKKQIHKVIRARLYYIDVEENENKDFVKNFVNFRLKLYNPLFKKNQDVRLAKLILTVISRYPDAVKNKKIVSSHTSIFNKDDFEIQKLSSELMNMYKLTESEVQQTIQKIIEYNRKNVKFTEEEETVITNSELLRTLLESITFLLQEFVEKCNNWKKYFLKTYLFDDPALIKVLNFDKKFLFGERFEDKDFVELVFTKNIKGELEPLVGDGLKPLLKKDVSAVINRMKKKIIKEEKEFIDNIKKSLAGNIVLLYQNNELPSWKVLNSLLTKSFKFHKNYFPDLMENVESIKKEILEILGEQYEGYWRFIDTYHEEISDFIYDYSKENFKITYDFAKFMEILEQIPEKNNYELLHTETQELLPEELKFISSNLDVEPAIMELNEKIRIAEKNIPILEDEYFFTTKKDYIKTAILETLSTLLNTKEKPELIHSVLIKTLDRSEGESSKIALELLNSIKTDGLKPNIVNTLLKKQKAKNHIANKIKQLLLEEDNVFYENQENLKIEMQKFSKLTGIGFFTATVNDNENYKITAQFKDGEWKITHFTKIHEFGF